MANTKNFIAKNGVSTGDGYAMPDVRPSLLLDFANSKTLDPRITFTRGSTGTYWDGKTTTKAEENLITYSQDIVAGNWNISRLDITDNQTAPDGTSTAQLLTPQANAGYHYAYVGNSPVTTAPNTLSVYAKNNGANYAFLRSNSSGGYCGVNFDLSNSGSAAVEGSGNIDSYSATDVGNGWYRLTVTFNVTLAAQTQLLINGNNTDTADTWTGDGTSGIYFWGAQLENRSSATAYTPTTSSPIVKYQPTLQTAASGEARFDHDPVTGESKGLLIEEARTNLIKHSGSVLTSPWAADDLRTFADYSIAPDGTQTAALVTSNSTSNRHRIKQAFSVSSGSVYTLSIYAKSFSGGTLYINAGSLLSATGGFELSGDGSIPFSGASNVDEGIEYVGNGWYHCYITGTAQNTSGTIFFQVNDAGTYTDVSWGNGDNYTGLLLWGGQMEVGAFPTSYIPTSGSTVARSADSAYIDNISDWYSHSSGSTVYFEANNLHDYPTGNNSRTLEFFTSTTSSTGIISVLNNVGTGYIEAGANYGSSWTIGLLQRTRPAQNTDYKGAFAWSDTEAAFVVGDQAVATDTGYLLEAPNYLGIGRNYNNSSPINGSIKKIAYYPQRLSNATLQQMTEE